MNTMKILIILGSLTFSYCIAQTVSRPTIEHNEFKLFPDGDFFFKVATSDGFTHEAKGELENKGTADESQIVRGRYSYVGPDGKLYEVIYVAGKDGFRPYGEHIPQLVPPSPYPTGQPVFQSPIAADCGASLCGTGLG